MQCSSRFACLKSSRIVVREPDDEGQVASQGVEALIGEDNPHAEALGQGQVKAVVEGAAVPVGRLVGAGQQLL